MRSVIGNGEMSVLRVFPGLWVAFMVTEDGYLDCVSRGTNRVQAVTRCVRKSAWLEHVSRAQFGSTNLLED